MKRSLVILAVLGLAGCGGTTGLRPPHEAVGISAKTAEAIDQLVGTAPGLSPDTTILVASLSYLDDLSKPSDLGQLVSEEAGGRLIQLGFKVPEVRLTDTLHVREGGEFLLSRNVPELRRVHNAEVAVTGTVAEYAGVDYVNLRLIRLADGMAISAVTFAVPGRTASEMGGIPH
jgi:hypothetical protein